MAAPVILVEAQPRLAADGSAATVRLAGGGGVLPYHYSGEHWRAGIAGLPTSVSSLDFDGEQLGGGGVAQAMELRWAPGSNAALRAVASLFWTDAPIVVRVGAEGDAMPPVVASGLVLETAIDGGGLRIALADKVADLNRSVLVDRFAGTGGIEGPVEFEGVIKSRAWGRCFNVAGKPLVPASNIWVFGDPRRPWQAFDAVRTQGVAPDAADMTVLGWQGSAEATLAALIAASPIEGGGIKAPSIACVKWWTEPDDLRADIRGEIAGGYVETAAEIAARIVASRSTLAFAAGAIAAAVTARPGPFGWRVENEANTAAGEISELLAGVSLSWLIVDDQVAFRPWDWTAPSRAVRSHDVTRRQVYKPVATRKLGYRRNWSPMARGDLAAIVLARDVIYEGDTSLEEAITNAGETADWEKVADPTGTKPADNATKGATIGVDVVNPDGSVYQPGQPGDVDLSGIEAQISAERDRALADVAQARAQIVDAKAVLQAADDAIRASVASIAADYTTAGAAGAIAQAKVNDEAVVRAGADGALAGRLQSIEADYTTAGAAGAIAQAKVNDEAVVRASAVVAVASRVQSLETDVGGVHTVLSQQASLVSGIDGRTRAYWNVSVNGGVPIFSAYYIDDDGVVRQGARVGGDLTVDGNLLVGGSVKTAAVADNAMTGGAAYAGSSTAFSNTAPVTLASVSYTGSGQRTTIHIAGIVTLGASSASGAYCQIYLAIGQDIVFGPEIMTRGRGAPAPFSFPVVVYGYSGTQTFKLFAQASAGSGLGDPHVVDVPTIIINEFKK